MTFQITSINKRDQKEVLKIVADFWGDETIICHDEIFYTSDLEGLKAVDDNKIIGILHYQITDKTCEIITLASLDEDRGVGSALIKSLEGIAREKGCNKLCLITTNDNLHALGFYQRRGFHLTDLYPGQLKKSRRIKPAIPEIGLNNIPLRDELRLEKDLD